MRRAVAGAATLLVILGVFVAVDSESVERPRAAPAAEPVVAAASSSGAVVSFGSAGAHGQPPAAAPVAAIAATPAGGGYWLAGRDGGVFALGDAGFHGSAGGVPLNHPVVGLAATPSGGGYWLVARDGGIFAYGDAAFHGSTGAIRLNQPIVGMASTPDGRGYWLVARDGGIFAFGDAAFHGSTGAIRLNQPIVGMASTPGGRGYWLVARDGGVFAFGDAAFHGSAVGRLRARTSAIGMAATPDGRGYWIAGGPAAMRVMVAGDVHGEGPVRALLDRGENPLSEMRALFAQADVVAVNLETPAAQPGQPQPKEFVFLAAPSLLPALRQAGVTVVSSANNHALDHGRGALMETLANARSAGLVAVGAGANRAEAFRPAYVDVGGQVLGVVGLSKVVPPGWAATAQPGVASAYDEAAALAAVREAASRADAVLVLIHWGVELARCPSADQVRLARRLHEAGATVVAGHHPHVLQPLVTGAGDVTAFSLGNFVWYHDRPPSNATGVLDVSIDGGTVVDTTFHPAVVGRDGRPRLTPSGAPPRC